jgi:hypothetical protein
MCSPEEVMEQTRKNLHRSEDSVIDLDLAVWDGRYELLFNIGGHYGAGVYAELDAVTNR